MQTLRLPFRLCSKHAMPLWLGLGALLACGGEPPPSVPVAEPVPATSVPATSSEEPGFFIDAAEATGLRFEHWNGMVGEYDYSEMMGSGAAVLDFDRDGDLDLYLVQGGSLRSGREPLNPPPGPLPLSDRLFRNEMRPGDPSSLRFTDITEGSGIEATGYGMGVVAADFDRDGWIDLYLTNAGSNQLWHNNGDGTFSDVTARSGTGERRWSVPAVAADFDRDGWVDLFVGNYVDYTPATNKRCTDELGAPNYCGPLAYAPLADTLYRNRGDGTFEDISGKAGLLAARGGALGAVAADFDRDGRIDLYVANDGMPNQLWMQLPGGQFENRAVLGGCAVNGQGHPEASMGVAAADFDRDGDEDLFMTHLAKETHTLYANDGHGLFSDVTVASGLARVSFDATGFGTGFFDFDNDGWLDLLAVNGAVKVIKSQALRGEPYPLRQPNQLFRGRDGRFEDVSAQAGAAFALSEVSRGAAFGDVDNDGDTDVLVSQNNGPPRLLLNQVGQDGRWIGVELKAAGGGSSAGAWVSLGLADGRRQERRVGGNGSYASASEPRILFGLGDGEEAEDLQVEWPNGRRETFPPPALGRYTTFQQGEGDVL